MSADNVNAEASPDHGDTLEAPIAREPSAAIRFMIDLARFGGRQLVRHRAPQLAAALSYRTIFSLVPVLVLSLVLFKALMGPEGVREGLENVLRFTGLSEIRLSTDGLDATQLETNDSTVPDAQTGDAIPPSEATTSQLTTKIEEFVDKTVSRIQGLNFGAITLIGALVLIYAALTLIVQVEQAFNVVCRAPSGRRWIARFLTYWALLTLGPALLVGGIIVSNILAGRADDLPEWLSWASSPLQIITRFGLSWIILILAYTLLPNTRVQFRPAAIGALVAAILWESLKGGLGQFAGQLTDAGTQFAVYGSLALIPLFLLWIYITWLIVLFGLELTYALQTVSAGRAAALERLDERTLIDPGMAVLLMVALADGFRRGEPTGIGALSSRLGLAESTLEPMLERLRERGLVHRIEHGKDTDAYTLARSPEQITGGQVVDVVYASSGLAPGSPHSPDNAILKQLRQTRSKALETTTVAQLLERHSA